MDSKDEKHPRQVLRQSLKLPLSSSKKAPSDISQINKIVGYVNDEYKCVHNNFSGILYVGPLAVVFLGRIFFFEWTVVIKWEDVVHVTKHEGGVSVEVTAPKPAIYDFEQVFNQEKAFNTLVSLHNDSIIDAPRRLEPTPRQVARSLRRMNSDPLNISEVFNFAEPPAGLTGDIFSPKSRRARTRSGSLLMSPDVAPAGSMESSDDSTTNVSKTALTKQWSELLDDTTSYTETAVESFFNHFVKDGADYSIREFMTANGDEEIDISVWKKAEESSGMCRTIEYTHPVNAPMAPPKARARKEQKLRRFGGHGLVIETKTFVSDVPMTDCFYVADMVRVEAVEDKVSISMQFEVTFVKSTMFKSIITRTTTGEIHGFMQNFANFMAKSLGDAALVTPAPETSRIDVPTPAINSPSLQQIIVALCAGVLLLQLMMLMEMRSMRMDIRELQASHHHECIPNVLPVDEM